MRILLLGEALVDLVCERPVAGLADADAFVPHPGGAVANVAAVAARHGAQVALAGGAGSDPWGVWLRDHLAAEGVDLSWFALHDELRTPVAFVAVDGAGEPTFHIYGQEIAATVAALAPRIDEAVEACGALFASSNTLVAEDERAVTMAARERALALGRPFVFDPNLRLHRWPTAARAAAAARELVPGALLVRCNAAEAEILTGESDPAAGAESLLAAGAQHAIVTLGAGGALLRGGGMRLDVPGVPARTVDTTGAGDTLTGVLLARLAASAFYPATLAMALPEAVERAARATEHFGAHPPRA
ncbi:MAG: carbohydrate kinase family protein [Solirubrobacteraceae bacterium]